LRAVRQQAERALLIPVGAAVAARDVLADVFGRPRGVQRQLGQFERRGATAVRRNRRRAERQARAARRDVRTATRGVRRSAGEFRSDADHLVDRVQRRFNGR
jgi:hypothetical protein